jgi:hypothetical protein
MAIFERKSETQSVHDGRAANAAAAVGLRPQVGKTATPKSRTCEEGAAEGGADQPRQMAPTVCTGQ